MSAAKLLLLLHPLTLIPLLQVSGGLYEISIINVIIPVVYRLTWALLLYYYADLFMVEIIFRCDIIKL